MMSKTVLIESEMVIKDEFRFCNTYLKTFSTKFNFIKQQPKILVQPVNCCSYYMNIVSNTIQASIPPCICMLIYSNKNYF